MKKLIFIFLLSSCISHKEVIMETVTECDEVKADAWARECISGYKLDSTQINMIGSVKQDCYKQAKIIFCKQVQKEKK